MLLEADLIGCVIRRDNCDTNGDQWREAEARNHYHTAGNYRQDKLAVNFNFVWISQINNNLSLSRKRQLLDGSARRTSRPGLADSVEALL